MGFVHFVQTVKFQDLEWSLWDRWILEGDLTVQQVLDWFKVGHSFLSNLLQISALYHSWISCLWDPGQSQL